MTARWSTTIGSAMAVRPPASGIFAWLSGNTGSRASFNLCVSRRLARLLRCFEFGRAREVKEAVAIDVSLDVVGEPIEGRFDVGFVGKTGSLACNTTQPVAALPVVGKEPVNLAPGDAARAVNHAFVASVVETQKRIRALHPGRASDLHFVALEGRATVGTLAEDFDEHLVTLKHRLDIQQTETGEGP